MEIEQQATLDINGAHALPLSPEGKFTRESLLLFSKLNPNIQVELDEKGNLILMSPTSIDSGENSGIFYGELYLWNKQNGKPGHLFDSSTGFTLPDTSVKSPDAAWIENSRHAALDEKEKSTYARIVPDLVGEVRSKSDKFQDTFVKCKKWLENGVKEVWCIDPGIKIIILRKGEEVSFIGDEVAVSKQLMGFEMKASDFVLTK
ncbi:MAG: Uma2 family endonuclease [Bacteroidota bacterium]